LPYSKPTIYTESSVKAKTVFLSDAAHYRSSKLLALVATLACAFCALAQSESPIAKARSHPVRQLALEQTKYRMRPGETVPIAAPRETLDFIRNAKNRFARSSDGSGNGFVIGPSGLGDQVVLAASLASKPGEYTVSLSAVSKTGEKRVTTLSVTLDPVQPAPSAAAPVVSLNGLQTPIFSTPALIRQGWVVPGAFEPIPPALRADVQSQLVLDDKYDSLENTAGDNHSDAR
jgi:hypothetical protein